MRSNNSPVEDLRTALEQMFIDKFLEGLGYRRDAADPRLGPGAGEPDVASGLSRTTVPLAVLRAASEHASLRLAEIEARARYVTEIHHSS